MEYDTIAALSTPPGRGGVGLIRVSGSTSLQILKSIVFPLPKKIEPRKLIHGFLHNKQTRIDECLFVFFPSPHSFTGEDIVEISLHSNPFLIEEVLNLIFLNGARMALPGEFSYRAFKNGKIDLLQAEAVNELIRADSRYHAHLEFNALQGKLSRQIQEIRNKLIDFAVRIETIIEFQEDQHLENISFLRDMSPVTRKLKEILRLSRFNDILSQGLRIVIAGKVNVGKSTLFNALLNEERSIISSFPGTTRDFIKEKLYVDGYPFEITDIAGFQISTSDQVEKEGISRSLIKIKEADAVILVLDATEKLDKVDRYLFSMIQNKNKLLVINKIDIASARAVKSIVGSFPGAKVVHVSAKKAINLESIFSFLRSLLAGFQEKRDGWVVNFRQKCLLEKLCVQTVAITVMIGKKSLSLELVAEELRTALTIIGKLTGEITTEDLLKEIFGSFCIGK